MKSKAIVYVRFPKTGLGNMMLVWARGLVFAKINQLELVTSSWFGFRWGAIVRWEKKKRLYRKYFVETPITKRIVIEFLYKTGSVCREPMITEVSEIDKRTNKIFLFDNPIAGGSELFGDLRIHRDFIRDKLFEILLPKQKNQLDKCDVPVISVHIRRGDFKIANPITPLAHFIKAIEIIREEKGEDLPVTIFSDAEEFELKDILQIAGVTWPKGNSDIVDLLLMSKSKFIVLSQSSSFSYWAAFLSNAFVIKSSHDWQRLIKGDNIETGYREIEWDFKDYGSTEKLERKLKEYINESKK